MWPPLVLVLVFAAGRSPAAGAELGAFEVLHEWRLLDFDWPSAAARREANSSSALFEPEYCMLSDVKAVDGEVFVTVPRWRHGVPASVNQVVVVANRSLLRPYPSWAMNQPGDCHAIQYAHVIEIDPLRRMWIVDTGRRDVYTRPDNKCPPKLVVWDMVADREVRRYVFPDEVVAHATAMLRGVVVDTASADPADWFAYIASTAAERLVVYSMRDDAAWSIQHGSMARDNSAISINVLGHHAVMAVHVDSLALAPRDAADQRLYFAAVASFKFYSVPTWLLRNRTLAEAATEAELDRRIEAVGVRSSQSEGMTVSADGVMYYSVLNNNAINQWNISRPFNAVDQVFKDDARLQWPDSFGWDDGYLYFTSNKMHLVFDLDLGPPENTLFRVMRAKVGTAGYMGPYAAGQTISVKGAAAPGAHASACLAALIGVALLAAL